MQKSDKVNSHELDSQIISLMALLRDGSTDHPARGEFPRRYGAVAGLVKLGSVAVEPLCHALLDPEGYTRRFAAEALARIADPRAIVPLLLAFQDSEVYVQRYVAGALAKVGDAQVVAPLCTALGHPEIARETLYALEKVLERIADNVSIDDLHRVLSLENNLMAVIEVPDTDGGYLSWEQVEQWLDCRFVKQLAQQALARRATYKQGSVCQPD